MHSECIPAKPEPQIYLVDKIGAPSSVITMGHTSLPYDATGEFYKNVVSNYMLGGNFNSRLNLNLREEKGYTYGITSFFDADKYHGVFVVNASVKRQKTASSLSEIIKEMKNYIQNGLTDNDVAFTKNSYLNREAMRYETNYNKLTFLNRILEFNLGKDYPLQQANLLKSMTKADFNSQIKKEYDPDRMVILIVGDKVAVRKQFETLDLNIKDFSNKLNIKKFKEN